MIVSNSINMGVPLELYKFDRSFAIWFAELMGSFDLGIESSDSQVVCKHRYRNQQSVDLLRRLDNSLVPCRYGEWLGERGVSVGEAFSIDYDLVTLQDLMDLYVFPDDYILDNFGVSPIEGPVFVDRRDDVLVGVCVRNITKNRDYAAAEKFTFSNYGWFVFGYDLYNAGDRVFLVEGVFDAIAMRRSGFNAIALGAACPSPLQLACLIWKFSDLCLCLDNDFWGRVGSYITSSILGIPAFTTEKKDPGCYLDGPVELLELDIVGLGIELPNEVEEYNKLSRAGLLERPLPYN